jgi:hypothetical protein
MNLEETSVIVTTVFLQYPHAEVTAPIVRLWHRALGDYPAEVVTDAVMEVLVTYKATYPPTIAHVAEVLRSRDDRRAGNLTDGEAWELLTNSISRFGRYNQAGAMHAIREQSEMVAEAAKMLGWQTICRWHQADEVGNRAHFWRVISGLRNAKTVAWTKREMPLVVQQIIKRELPRGN